MQKILTIVLTAAFIGLISFSCNPTKKEAQISTDIVFNPNTAQDAEEMDEAEFPKIKFEHVDFDFGLIFEGEKVMHKYTFTNTGTAPLIISEVSATCGCTVPTFSKEPIAPGKEGFVEVKFDSSGRNGMQHKSVTVLCNTQPNRIELSFIAEIED